MGKSRAELDTGYDTKVSIPRKKKPLFKAIAFAVSLTTALYLGLGGIAKYIEIKDQNKQLKKIVKEEVYDNWFVDEEVTKKKRFITLKDAIKIDEFYENFKNELSDSIDDNLDSLAYAQGLDTILNDNASNIVHNLAALAYCFLAPSLENVDKTIEILGIDSVNNETYEFFTGEVLDKSERKGNKVRKALRDSIFTCKHSDSVPNPPYQEYFAKGDTIKYQLELSSRLDLDSLVKNEGFEVKFFRWEDKTEIKGMHKDGHKYFIYQVMDESDQVLCATVFLNKKTVISYPFVAWNDSK